MNEQIFFNALMLLFGIHIIHTYLTSLRGETVRSKVCCYMVWAVYILFLYLVMFSNSRYPLFTLLGNFILLAALLFVYGCGDIKTALFRSGIYHTSRMAVEVATQNILLVALSEDPFVAGNLISSIAMYIIVQIYKRWKGRDLTVPLSFRYWIRLFAVPLSSTVVIHYAHETAMHSGWMAFFYILSVFIILNNYLIFDLYDKMSAQMLMERQNRAYEQEIELCVRQAAEREEAYQQTRTLRHDLKGRLVALGAMLEEGQTERAKGEIARMLRENSLNRHGTAETGNLALDALVNYKYDAALSEGIRMECHLEVPAELFLDSTDLCVILGNLLDNAVEAVQKLPEGADRRISLTVRLTKGVILIAVENPYDGEIMEDGSGRIRSSKGREHGIGLLSVERIAEKYGGTVSIRHEGGMFRISVMLLQRKV
ncbi:MAG: GHKL domain-containing protein [bacterium]|nr:GHKL domain-containing protein [bacterium]MCM1424618.1 GHKL domain-containing protein [bacterium]